MSRPRGWPPGERVGARALSFPNDVFGEKPQAAEFLFVQNARSITHKDGRLTLKGVNPVTILFSDRPERIAGHRSTERFVPFWGEGSQSFLLDPPNATLSFLEHKDMEDAVVVLQDPRLEGEDLSYQVRVLEGERPEKGGGRVALHRHHRHAIDAGLFCGGTSARLAPCRHLLRAR